MFEIGGTEILVILILALLVLGPQNLPKIARSIGKVTSQFRRISNEFRDAIDDEVRALEVEERKKDPEKRDAAAPSGAASGEEKSKESGKAGARPDIQHIDPAQTSREAPKPIPRGAADPYGLGAEGERDPDWSVPDESGPDTPRDPDRGGGEPK